MPKEERRIGRPSRIVETIEEVRCPFCRDWIRAVLYRHHLELEHPFEPMPIGGEVREVPLPQRIVDLVAAGNYLESAAGAVGVGNATVQRWLAIGAEWDDVELEEVPPDRRIYREFRDAIANAREEARARFVRRIEKAGEKDWKALAWLLERTDPGRFSRIERLRVGGDRDAAPVRFEYETKDPDFVREVVERLGGAGVLADGVPSSEPHNEGENGNGTSHSRNGRGPS